MNVSLRAFYPIQSRRSSARRAHPMLRVSGSDCIRHRAICVSLRRLAVTHDVTEGDQVSLALTRMQEADALLAFSPIWPKPSRILTPIRSC